MSVKRVFVDDEGNAIRNVKRIAAVDIKDGKKEEGIIYCLCLSIALTKEMNIDINELKDVVNGTEIFSVAYTIHQYMRAKYNTNNISQRLDKMEKTSRTFFVRAKSYSVEKEKMKKIWIESYKNLKRLFSNNEMVDELENEADIKKAVQEIMPNVSTTVCLVQLFKQRLKDLQTGPDSWIYKKTGDVIELRSLSSYGIRPQYRHFCSGLSWDPVLRSTLGYMTTGVCQAALLTTIGKDKELYKQKHVNAVERSFKYLPEITKKNITDVLKGFSKQSDKAMIVNELANLTALFGDTAKTKCAIPISIIADIILDEKNEIKIENCKYIGFSSKKAVLCYMMCNNISIPENCDSSHFKQIYFHSIFGTQSESFSILSQTTNNANWDGRNKMNLWQSIKSKNVEVSTKREIIKVLLYSKNKNASQISFGNSGIGTVGVYSMDSGFKRKNISEELLNFVKGGNSYFDTVRNASAFDVLQSLIDFRKNAISFIEEKKKSRNGFVVGTVAWRKVSNNSVLSIGCEKGQDGEIYADGNGMPMILEENNEICYWSTFN